MSEIESTNPMEKKIGTITVNALEIDGHAIFEASLKNAPTAVDIASIICDEINPVPAVKVLEMLDAVGVEWVTENGKLIKRIKRYLKREHGVQVDDNALSAVGEKIRALYSDDNYSVCIDRNFVWAEGEYGDKGSCFWSFNTAHRAILASPLNTNCFAVKIKTANGKRARCWLIDDPLYGKILFNSYGDLSLSRIAEILNSHYLTIIAKVYFTIPSIWTNNNSAYVLESSSAPSVTLINYTLKSDTAYCPVCESYLPKDDIFSSHDDGRFGCSSCVSTTHCEVCGCSVEENEAYLVNGFGTVICESCGLDGYNFCSSCDELLGDTDIFTHSGEVFCERCYLAGHSTCDICSAAVSNDYVVHHEGHTLCEDCFSYKYTQCQNCYDYVKNEDVVEYKGEKFCNQCFRKCDVCSAVVRTEEIIHHDGHTMCEDCFNSHYKKCQHCYDYLKVEDTFEHEGYFFCNQCFRKCDVCSAVVRTGEITQYERYALCKDCFLTYVDGTEN